jgi:RNase P/RNase MRP subunit p29
MKRTLLFSSLLLASFTLADKKTPTVLSEISIDGPGYFRFIFDGQIVYSKISRVIVDDRGRLADEKGGVFSPTLYVPKKDDTMTIGIDGWVSLGKTKIGRLVIAIFENEGLVEKSGDYLVSPRRPKTMMPGSKEEGVILTRVSYVQTPVAVIDPPVRKPNGSATGEKKKEVLGSAMNRPLKGYPTIPEITIRVQTEVKNDNFTLGDIAEISADPTVAERLSKIQIGSTPVVGVDRKLDLPYVRTMLKAAGEDPTKLDIEVPPEAKVFRISQKVEQDDLVETAIAAAEAKFGKNGTLKAATKSATIRVPKGLLELNCFQVFESADGIRATIEIIVDGRRINTSTVHLVREGGIPKVSVGAQVRVIARAGNLAVETSGRVTKVLQNGTVVEVKTTEGTILSGRVRSDGSVEIE